MNSLSIIRLCQQRYLIVGTNVNKSQILHQVPTQYRVFHALSTPKCSSTNISVNACISFPKKQTFVTITKTSSTTNGEPISSPPPPPSKTSSLLKSQPQSQPNPIITKTPASEDFPVTITASCTQRIHNLAKMKKVAPSSIYLRIYVDAGGCSGFQYRFEIETHDEEPLDNDDDMQFHVGESSVVIDRESLDFMRGCTIDYVNEMIRSGFKIAENPLSESACGCGSSFAVKNFETNR